MTIEEKGNKELLGQPEDRKMVRLKQILKNILMKIVYRPRLPSECIKKQYPTICCSKENHFNKMQIV